MEDKNYKDLDNFFKTRLNQSESQSNGWDVPSDSILENVLDQVIVKYPNDRKYPIYTIVGGLLLTFITIGFLFLRFQDKAQIQALNQQIENLHVELDRTKVQATEIEATSLLLKKTSSKESKNILENETDKELPIAKTNRVKKSVRKTVRENIDLNQKQIIDSSPTTTMMSNELQTSSRESENQRRVILASNTPVANKSRSSLDELSLLQSDFHLIKSENRSPSLKMEDINVTSPKNIVEGKISAYLTIGHVLSYMQMTNLSPASYSLTNYDNYYSGWRTGIGAAYKFSKNNQIKSELSYSIYNNESNFYENSTYVKNNELTDNNGGAFYAASLDINSPTGKHTENLLIDVTNEDMSDGDQMENRTDIYQRFHVLSLNTTITQTLLNANNFKLEFYGGLGINTFINAEQTMDISIEMNDKKMAEKNINDMDGMYALNKFYLNGQIGLELSKHFSNKYFIGINSGYNRSLTSIRKVTNTNEPNTYIGTFQSSLIAGYRF